MHDAVGSNTQLNTEIVGIIASQFESQTTYRDVAQATVDEVVRHHHRVFESLPSAQGTGVARSRAHDDITLIVRGFNYPLAKLTIDFHTAAAVALADRAAPGPSLVAPLSISIPLPGSTMSADSPPRPFFGSVVPMSQVDQFLDVVAGTSETDDQTSPSSFGENTTTATTSVEESVRALAVLNLDESGRVRSYVDFGDFDAAINLMTEGEREALFAELEPRPDFEPIPEEREPLAGAC